MIHIKFKRRKPTHLLLLMSNGACKLI
jgi:hypothetical protein